MLLKEIYPQILRYLPGNELLRLRIVSKQFNKLLRSDDFWKRHFIFYGDLFMYPTGIILGDGFTQHLADVDEIEPVAETWATDSIRDRICENWSRHYHLFLKPFPEYIPVKYLIHKKEGEYLKLNHLGYKVILRLNQEGYRYQGREFQILLERMMRSEYQKLLPSQPINGWIDTDMKKMIA